jgi:hypothetical protein
LFSAKWFAHWFNAHFTFFILIVNGKPLGCQRIGTLQLDKYFGCQFLTAYRSSGFIKQFCFDGPDHFLDLFLFDWATLANTFNHGYEFVGVEALFAP